MTKKAKIIAFAGSNSSRSINYKLVQFALDNLVEYETELLDLNDYEMPIYSIDRQEKDGFPQKAHGFLKKMHEADAIVCSMAEHNHSYTAAFKNILDWCSRIDRNIFGLNPMLLMSTSPGGYGGGNVMDVAKAFFPKCGAEITETFSLPHFNKNFNDGEIVNKELKDELLLKIATLREVIETKVRV